jgi:hypothetical protein
VGKTWRRNPLLWAVLAAIVVAGTAISREPLLSGLLGFTVLGSAWVITHVAKP